jgi:hypothetical protein
MLEEMSEGMAQARIEEAGETAEYPALLSAQVSRCVAMARRRDWAGREPSETGWTPTWDIAAGAALAWRMKAGRVAGNVDLGPSPDRVRLAQVFAHCREQAAFWESRMEPISAIQRAYEDVTVELDEVPQPEFDRADIRSS